MLFRMWMPVLLVLAVAVGAVSCGDSTSPVETGPETRAPGDVIDVQAPDVLKETAGPEELAAPVLMGNVVPFSSVGEAEDAVVYVTSATLNGPDLITLRIRARNLGSTAGIAFYLEYDPEFLEYDNATAVVAMDSGGNAYFDRSVAKEMSPGKVTFGVARFCKAKIPWGSVDQCGGVAIDTDTEIVALTFKLKQTGQTSVRFPAEHTLIRRPDRSSVKAKWVGGRIDIDVAGGN